MDYIVIRDSRNNCTSYVLEGIEVAQLLPHQDKPPSPPVVTNMSLNQVIIVDRETDRACRDWQYVAY